MDIAKWIGDNKYFAAIALLGSILAGLYGFIEHSEDFFQKEIEPRLTADISGSWCLTDTVKDATIDKYKGASAIFFIHIVQDGKRLSGQGDKVRAVGIQLTALELSHLTLNDGIATLSCCISPK